MRLVRNDLRRHGFVRDGTKDNTIERSAHPILYNRLAEHEILSILEFAEKSEYSIKKSCFIVKRDEVHKYLSDMIKMRYLKSRDERSKYSIENAGKLHLDYLRKEISKFGMTI